MAGLSADRPSEVVLAARVAQQFYVEGVSKVDIADRLGISRFRVARLLDSAREAGMRSPVSSISIAARGGISHGSGAAHGAPRPTRTSVIPNRADSAASNKSQARLISNAAVRHSACAANTVGIGSSSSACTMSNQ